MEVAPPHQFEALDSFVQRFLRRVREGLPWFDGLSDRCRRCYLPRINHPVVNTVPSRSKHRRGLTTTDREEPT